MLGFPGLSLHSNPSNLIDLGILIAVCTSGLSWLPSEPSPLSWVPGFFTSSAWISHKSLKLHMPKAECIIYSHYLPTPAKNLPLGQCALIPLPSAHSHWSSPSHYPTDGLSPPLPPSPFHLDSCNAPPNGSPTFTLSFFNPFSVV